MAEAITRAAEAVETCRRHGNLRSQFVALQWLAGFLLVDDQFEAGNTKAQQAFELARAREPQLPGLHRPVRPHCRVVL